MHIRPAKPQDAEAIRGFDCFGGDRPQAIEQGRCLVAVNENRIAGFVVYQRNGLIGRHFIEFLVVDEPYRRQGTATALLRAVKTELAPCRLFISTEAGNTRMLELLDKDGWLACGQIDNLNDSGHAERFFYRDIT